jgi:hypothetical protein
MSKVASSLKYAARILQQKMNSVAAIGKNRVGLL